VETNETPGKAGGSASTTPSIPDQLRRRREASYRLPPLPCGHRDPLDCRESCRELLSDEAM
jgi:hypothetical protein